MLVRPLLTALGLALLPVAAVLVDTRATPREPAESYPARMALHEYFRALAAGDIAACGYMASEFHLTTFAEPGCDYGWDEQYGKLDDDVIVRLRHVTVPTAVRLRHDTYIVRNWELDWKGGHVSVYDEGSGAFILQYYVLRYDAHGWKVDIPAASNESTWIERDKERLGIPEFT
ncbi:hypothetical protein [Actinomadura sp. 7K507]|uniref:hypothetical protein n=1 Tax=Actinomadura sp. 7K507 TaxID=2530365 RepID=UPI00104C099E|nr:hypothetical protein [Actinomadura sp. 7K507]TDC93280.1 hypothetical protein E1285_10345 [Actinomadura sp. 7K507]